MQSGVNWIPVYRPASVESRAGSGTSRGKAADLVGEPGLPFAWIATETSARNEFSCHRDEVLKLRNSLSGSLGFLRECIQPWEIDDDCLLRAAGDHDHGVIAGVRIFFSVRNVRRHKDVIARRGDDADFLDTVMKYELGVALPYIDRCFGFAMVVERRLSPAHCPQGVNLWP